MDQELIEKGKALLAELGEDRSSTLHKWMIHYLVELVERAKSTDVQEARVANKECAEIITKLWQQKTDEEATQLRNKLHKVNVVVPSDDAN